MVKYILGANAWKFVLVLGLALHIALTVCAARVETPTIDEFAHVPAGLAYWKHGAWELYSKNPPTVKLWMTLPLALGMAGKVESPAVTVEPFGWGPWQYGTEFYNQNFRNFLHIYFISRLTIILLSAITGFLIFFWARHFTGQLPAALAAFGFWISPTILAHAHLGTIDIGTSFALFGLCYFLCRLSERPKIFPLASGGVILGLTLTTKFSALLILPLIAFACLTRARGYRVKALVIFMVASLISMQLVFGFSNWIDHSGPYKLTSKIGKEVSPFLPSFLPILIPRSYVQGLDAQTVDAETGEFGNYLNGHWSQKSWWYYNLEALGFKEHPATILLWLLLPFAFWKERLTNYTYLLLPAALLGIPLLFFNPIQVGVRYLLPLFPFLFLGMALLFEKSKILLRLAPVFLLAWTWSAVAAAPDFLTYFNAVSKVFGKPEDLLLDSNFDWGQDLYRIHGLDSEFNSPIGLMYFGHVSPQTYGISYNLIPDHPVRGILAVSANLLEGMDYPVIAPDGGWVEVKKDQLAWLKALTPIRREGSIMIFDTRSGP